MSWSPGTSICSRTYRPRTSTPPRSSPRTGERTPARDAFACNDALLLLSALAYGLMHGLRVMAERATQRGWSLQRLREQLLKVAARLRRGGRRLTFVLPRAAARLQGLVWRQLDALGPLPA